MRGRLLAGVLVPSVLLVGAGGYAWADAEDLVPGWITTAAEPVPPAPFLTAQAVAPASAEPELLPMLMDDGAPIPDAATLTAAAQALRDDPRTGRSTNVSVIDLITGQVLVDLGAAEPQVPASTTKLLTAIAVISELGPDARLATVARYDAATGKLALVAGGDMMLAADKGTAGASPLTSTTWGADMPAYGYAGLGDLADQIAGALAAQGVSQVEIVVDTSAFPGPAYPSEWPAYAASAGYAAPVTGLAVEIGKLTSEEYGKRSSDPAGHAGEILAQRLEERGIAVTDVDAGSGVAGVEVGKVESAPLSDVVAYMLHASDNTVAEVLTRVLAIHQGRQAVPAEATKAVAEAIAKLGVDTTGLALYDGAGYSSRNQIPPQVLTQSLRAAVLAEPTADLLGWLAESGLNGTMADRYLGGPGAGVIRAKTGSLTGVTTLTGVVFTADGRPLAFAVMADGMPAGQDRPRAAVDAFVATLAQCGCGA